MSKKILVVDDEKMILETFEAFLALSGYEPVVTDNVSSAKSLIEENNDFAMIITDLRMPGEDGLTFVNFLNKNFPAIPVVIITGNPEADSTFSAFQRGVVQYLVKPVGRKELLAAVEKVFESQASGTSNEQKGEIDELLEGLNHVL